MKIKTDNYEIYKGDCLVVMESIPSESVGLIVTDPPYLINYKSNFRTKTDKFDKIKNDVNSHDLISNYLAECYRIMKDNTAIYCFCSWHNVDFFKQEFEKHFKLKNIIVWNKNNHGGGDLKGSYAPKHEFILFGHKGRTPLREKRIPDVIDCAKIPGMLLVHPTEKPLGLLSKFIKQSSDGGDIIFDGFMGSGSTGVACMLTDRKFIGIELDDKYFEIAENRIKESIDKKEELLKLFVETN